MKKILILGGKGFVGRFLALCVKEQGGEPLIYDLGQSEDELLSFYSQADYVIDAHGLNRSEDASEFFRVNVDETVRYASLAKERGIPYLFLSSIHAGNGTPYGDSKLRAEEELERMGDRGIRFVRLSNVFGPTCRPGYNSVIATWADAAARGKKEEIVLYPTAYDEEVVFQYVGDLGELIAQHAIRGDFPDVEQLRNNSWNIRLARLHELFQRLSVLGENEDPLSVCGGCGLPPSFLARIYGTYLYGKPVPYNFSLLGKRDERGLFVELMKGGFGGSSQVSLNIVSPGRRKGGHYHHHKIERFVRLDDNSFFELKDIFSGQFRLVAEPCLDVAPFVIHAIVSKGIASSQVVIWSSEPYLALQADTYR